jgi:CRISPR/Cas system-associated endonuclease Cas1
MNEARENTTAEHLLKVAAIVENKIGNLQRVNRAKSDDFEREIRGILLRFSWNLWDSHEIRFGVSGFLKEIHH